MSSMTEQQLQQRRMELASDTPRTGWSGWLSFGAVMLGLLAAFHVIAGLTALFNDEYFVVGSNGLVVELDYTAWGFIHLGIGALLAAGAVSLMSSGMFGRVIAVVAATVSAIVNLSFIAAYPVWSTVMIAVDVIVIYAVVVHGRELAY
jgi:hypothetical protein